MSGLLRKKGLFLLNERFVKITDEGLLTYYHLDKMQSPKETINLRDHDLIEIRFVYAGRAHPQLKNNENLTRLPHPDDEMRIFLKTGNFLFKSMTKIEPTVTTKDM